MNGLHPALLLFLTALLAACPRPRLRQVGLLAGTLLALLAVLRLAGDARWSLALSGYTVELLRVDALSRVFGLIFALITVLGILYALHAPRRGEQAAALVYAGAALGVVFAGDWLSLFVFWELMAVASLFVVWCGGTPRSRAAGFRYLLVHAAGGSLLLCGILLHLAAGHPLALEALGRAGETEAAFWLILLGVAVNAAVPPLHAWLPDAYPEASVSGSVFLSAFTTKAAVYVLARLFAGAEVLVWAGTVMALYGVVFALLEKDMRRLLAYHIVSQVGYMVTGVGLGTALALSGAVAHAFCHILYKALLFMATGAVLYATGRRRLTELGGLGRHLPLVALLYLVGALSISGAPLFNGFISKSMVIAAATEAHRPLVSLLLELASVGTFLSVGLKLPYLAFAGPDRSWQLRPVPASMLLAMGAAALLCLALGLFPGWLYARLPFAASYHPYSAAHVVSTLQLLGGTALGFWLCRAKLHGTPAITLDTDWWYRKLLPPASRWLIATARQTGEAWQRCGEALLAWGQNPALVGERLRRWQQGAAKTDQARLSLGLPVLWVVLVFAGVALYTAIAG